jgi:hypothetical protein
MTITAISTAAAISIYNQHAAAFSNVSAYVILHDGQPVATIAFKYPRDGAGRLYAYVHWIGSPMARGFAGGGGHDKNTAACAAAAIKMVPPGADLSDHDAFPAFRAVLATDDGRRWDDHLRDEGFIVVQAV